MSTKSIDQVIEAAIQQESQKGNPERHSVPWDDGTERLLVVNLPLAPLRLNPSSHRIKAQLAARSDHQSVAGDPFTRESQRIIADLLRATPGFDDLRADLKERRQREPGVVTREGVLVNANTRAVALRDLGATHIRVMVLPPGATSAQISELELRLQVSRDYKQDYTFTNRLLFIKDCLDAHWSVSRIASEVHGTTGTESKRTDRVHRDLRVLTMIDELIGMSSGRFGYPDFDDKSVALEELDRDYEDLKRTDPDAAIRLRTARQVAILSGVGYRDIRHIDQNFCSMYLEEEVEEDPSIRFLAEKADEIGTGTPGGLDLLGDSRDTSDRAGHALLQWLTKTAGQREVLVPAGEGGTTERARGDVVDALQTAVERAVETVKAHNQRGDLLKQPSNAVKDAINKLQAAEVAYGKTASDPRFAGEVTRLRDRVAAARRLLDSLTARIDGDFPPGGTS